MNYQKQSKRNQVCLFGTYFMAHATQRREGALRDHQTGCVGD